MKAVNVDWKILVYFFQDLQLFDETTQKMSQSVVIRQKVMASFYLHYPSDEYFYLSYLFNLFEIKICHGCHFLINSSIFQLFRASTQ